ncbi:MAG: pyridoxamine 5'-phosphate oxidase family protein [Syntrophorhabdaceae bacterium]|nr:pyridoxamine 5'-phosphate oxidase family protein [Syntrophorhabdaceae bacterium]
MRQYKKEIQDIHAIINLLQTAHVGRLGTVGGDGYPMIKPLNFVYDAMKIYFHSAKEGEKIEDIARDNRVCFEADVPLGYMEAHSQACEATYSFQSVIIKGRASLVTDDGERLHAFKLLMSKYQPEGGYGSFRDDKLRITAIIRIDIEEMKGKENISRSA